MTHVILVKKPENAKENFSVISVNDYNGYVVNTCPTFFGKNNQPTKEFITDNLFTEMRYPNNLFIILEVYDIVNDQLVLKKTFKIQSDHPLYVNHTVMGSKHWVFNGQEMNRGIIQICDLLNGKTLIPLDPQAYHLCETEDGMLLGVCSVDDSKMKFYPKSELEKGEEQKPLWEIDFPDISKFRYYPLFHFNFKDGNLIFIMYGGKGVYIYSIELKSGAMNWSQKLSKDDSSFNHFDVGCTMKLFDHSILTVVCIKGIGFSYRLIHQKFGNVLLEHSLSWEQWMIDKSSLLEIIQTTEDKSVKSCLIS
jgi:hypothetical protein